MAHLASAVRIRPFTRAVAHHAAPDRWRSLLTGHLPRPLARSLRQAGQQRLADQGRRPLALLGRWDPYGCCTSPPPGSVLALMASVVFPAMRCLEVTTLGLSAKSPTRDFATRPGPVPMTSVAAATDRETLFAAAAVPHMKDRDLARRHRSLQSRSSGQPHSACARLSPCLVLPRPLTGRRNATQTPAPTGVFSFWPAPASIPRLPRIPLHPRAPRGMMLPT